jgi:Fe-S-cluster containining protein
MTQGYGLSAAEILMHPLLGPKEAAGRVLARQRDAGTATALMMGIWRRLDRIVTAQDWGIECVKGCSICCVGAKVDVLAPEALAIAEYSRDPNNAEAFPRGVRDVQRAASVSRTLSAEERWKRQVPCVFLDDAGTCTIYAVRPLNCRKSNAVNRVECQESACSLDDPVIHRHPELTMMFAGALSGVEAALEEAGVDERSFELVCAVHAALSEQDAAIRWANEDRVFDAAIRPVDQADRVSTQAAWQRYARSGVLHNGSPSGRRRRKR